jgi:hypothetical protein
LVTVEEHLRSPGNIALKMLYVNKPPHGKRQGMGDTRRTVEDKLTCISADRFLKLMKEWITTLSNADFLLILCLFYYSILSVRFDFNR